MRQWPMRHRAAGWGWCSSRRWWSGTAAASRCRACPGTARPSRCGCRAHHVPGRSDRDARRAHTGWTQTIFNHLHSPYVVRLHLHGRPAQRIRAIRPAQRRRHLGGIRSRRQMDRSAADRPPRPPRMVSKTATDVLSEGEYDSMRMRLHHALRGDGNPPGDAWVLRAGWCFLASCDAGSPACMAACPDAQRNPQQ
uniref:Uncharacterized protein n=1 Tax=Ralstonia solanacearum TaxID=305 RepID=A0A0S4TW37_RALSL|nr:conserved protein of unknown function [Ralstonia solanacearum]